MMRGDETSEIGARYPTALQKKSKNHLRYEKYCLYLQCQKPQNEEIKSYKTLSSVLLLHFNASLLWVFGEIEGVRSSFYILIKHLYNYAKNQQMCERSEE
jgi:hypothetical protein